MQFDELQNDSTINQNLLFRLLAEWGVKLCSVDSVFHFVPVPKEIVPKITREDISIYLCNLCSHVFQVNVDKKLINDYGKNGSFLSEERFI